MIISNLASLAVVEEAFEDEVIPVQGNEHDGSTALLDSLDVPKDRIKWIKAEIARQIGMFGTFYGKFMY